MDCDAYVLVPLLGEPRDPKTSILKSYMTHRALNHFCLAMWTIMFQKKLKIGVFNSGLVDLCGLHALSLNTPIKWDPTESNGPQGIFPPIISLELQLLPISKIGFEKAGKALIVLFESMHNDNISSS